MTDVQALERARQSFKERAWAESYRLLEAADRECPLDPEDVERLATAAYLMGRDEESEAFWARAHQAFIVLGEAPSLITDQIHPAVDVGRRRDGCGQK